MIPAVQGMYEAVFRLRSLTCCQSALPAEVAPHQPEWAASLFPDFSPWILFSRLAPFTMALDGMRFVYLLNVALPGALAICHLFAPQLAADAIWQGHAGPRTSLALMMLGSWWAAVALISIGGLYSPLKFRQD